MHQSRWVRRNLRQIPLLVQSHAYSTRRYLVYGVSQADKLHLAKHSLDTFIHFADIVRHFRENPSNVRITRESGFSDILNANQFRKAPRTIDLQAIRKLLDTNAVSL